MSFLATGFLPFSPLNKERWRANGEEKNEEIREGRQQTDRQREEKLGWVTDIISVLVRLMEPWPASSGCQQASGWQIESGTE